MKKLPLYLLIAFGASSSNSWINSVADISPSIGSTVEVGVGVGIGVAVTGT